MKLLTRKTDIVTRIFVLSLVLFTSAFACKYTVRDIGFTDLGSTTYQLCIYVDNTTSQEAVATIERIAYAAFLDANVETEIIHTGLQSDHPAMDYFRLQKITSMPAVILAGPDGNTLMLPFSYTQEKFKESLWRLIEKVVSSPLRKKIVDMVTNTYGAVLLVEGKNKGKNRQAEKIILGAIGDILQMMILMPKPIKEPPQMIVLSEQAFSEETVLLWSLGTLVKETEEPQVVILYSRGRRIGPVLKGTEITRDNIFSLLAIIGADCECGLDRSVMLGKMIPLRWEREVQAGLIHLLGFDVENPMVKSEMRQILSMSPALQGGKKSNSPLSAYREGIIKFDPVSSVPTVSSDPFRASGYSESESTGNFFIRMGLYSFSGIIFIVLVIGCFIFIRARQGR